MVGLFSFDGPLYKDRDGIYCSITLTNEMFNRYFSVVNELIVIVRTFKTDKTYQEMNMKPLRLENMKVIEVENFNSFQGFFIDKRKFKQSIEQIIEKIDLIFARMPSQTSNVVLKIAQKMHKRYLVEVGGCAWDSFFNHGLRGKIIAPYMYFYARKNIKRAAFATYVTKEFLQRRYPNNGITTDCSNVYLPVVNKSILEERVEKIRKLDLKHPIFGQAVNSIDVKYKGEYLIIRALKKLKEKGIYAEFQIVGPGNGDFLKKEAKRNNVVSQVKFLGTLQKFEMTEWYKTIDIYVQPSKQEGLPRSVIEAMSVGCPALGSNIAGIPELLDKGCLFNPNNNALIISSIMMLLDKNKMTTEAIKNFEKSKEYNLEEIEKKRRSIFLKYRGSVCITAQ